MPVFYSRMAELTFKYLKENLLQGEQTELYQIIESSSDKKQLFEELTDTETLLSSLAEMDKVDVEAQWLIFKQQNPFPKKKIINYKLVAALFLLAITLVALKLLLKFPTPNPPTHNISLTAVATPPQSWGKLLLANGDTIPVTPSQKGSIASDKAVNIIQKDTQLIYEKIASATSQPGNNVLETYSGKQYKLTLPDGSKVRLNAATRIRYPTFFTGPDRIVTLEGEAWFEVAADDQHPFKVLIVNDAYKANSPIMCEIIVLGTHFNVKGYKNETIRTTLVKGKLRVTAGDSTKDLRTGQQVYTGKNGGLFLASAMESETATAWQENNFQFKEANLKQVMQEISRQYGMAVWYKGSIPDRKITLKVSRNKPLSELLNKLKSSEVEITSDQNNITVTSKG